MSDIDLREPDNLDKAINRYYTQRHPIKERLHQLKQRISLFFADPKKRLYAFIGIGVVIIASVGLGLYFLTYEKAEVTAKKEPKGVEPVTDAASAQYPSSLDGTLTTQELANRHPLAVIVENHPDARPQSGLNNASVVYEAIAEGGITRFMALFGPKDAEKVGPIRSARTYFVDWARGYEAYLAHVGGNIDALDQIKAERVLDLDQFAYPSSYWRDNSRRVASEHTMYGSTLKLRQQAESNNYSKANNFAQYKFKDDPAAEVKAALPAAQKVSINFSSSQYAINFIYDRENNNYKRLMAGTAHNDAASNEQITAKNVVAMTVNRRATTTRINEAGWDMTTIGAGPATIIMDGKAIKGSWKKGGKTDREIFYDEAGQEITFNRGKLWIAVIPPDGSVTSE